MPTTTYVRLSALAALIALTSCGGGGSNAGALPPTAQVRGVAERLNPAGLRPLPFATAVPLPKPFVPLGLRPLPRVTPLRSPIPLEPLGLRPLPGTDLQTPALDERQ